jgi:hypothetical protein
MCVIGFLAVAVAASRSSTEPNAGIDPDVLSAREAAWRAYFAGDVKLLGDLLPPEFIGIMDAPRLASRPDARTGAFAVTATVP